MNQSRTYGYIAGLAKRRRIKGRALPISAACKTPKDEVLEQAVACEGSIRTPQTGDELIGDRIYDFPLLPHPQICEVEEV